MRLRNIRGAKEAIAASPYVVQDAQQYRGRWNEFFGNCHPLHIEIGMGKGQFITSLAQKILESTILELNSTRVC